MKAKADADPTADLAAAAAYEMRRAAAGSGIAAGFAATSASAAAGFAAATSAAAAAGFAAALDATAASEASSSAFEKGGANHANRAATVRESQGWWGQSRFMCLPLVCMCLPLRGRRLYLLQALEAFCTYSRCVHCVTSASIRTISGATCSGNRKCPLHCASGVNGD